MMGLWKIVDNEELMECKRGDPVIYVCNGKDFQISWKKCLERNNLCTGNRYCISTNKINATRTSFIKQTKSIWNREET